MLVGLTGSFGSGKSTVLNCFEKLGANIVNSDESVRQIYENDQGFLSAIRGHFGASVFDGKEKWIVKRLEAGFLVIPKR